MATIQPIAGENEQHPDVALVERVRSGDISAYDELVRKYERQVFRIAQHITQNREDAEDVMQDAFLKAYEKLDQFQGESSEVLHMAGPDSSKRKPDAVAQAPYRQDGFDRRRHRYGRGQRAARPGGLGSRSGAELHAIRTGRDSSQNHSGSASRVPGGFRITRCGWTIHGRDGGDAGIERAGRKIAIAARPATVARTPQPLFQAEEGSPAKGSEK